MEEALIVMLHELGILRVIPASQVNPGDIDVMLPPLHPGNELSDRNERKEYYESMLVDLKQRATDPLPSGLCKACDGIKMDLLRKPQGLVHSESYWHLLASADGCPCCKMMVSSLRRANHPRDLHNQMAMFHPDESRPLGLFAGTEKRPQLFSGNLIDTEVIFVRVLSSEPFIRDGKLNLCEVPGSSHDELTTSDMLLHCLAKIQLLPQWPQQEPPGNSPERRTLVSSLPTRVLDLGNCVAPYNQPLCILQTIDNLSFPEQALTNPDQLPSAHYAALSYRWGAPLRNLVTTKDSLALNCQLIFFGKLPKTIQDAVMVTRRLGIRYLWVDALCIIQDDPEDWSREASKMGDVYSNALFTIAAHAAVHADDGFLAATFNPPSGVQLGKVDVDNNNKISDPLFLSLTATSSIDIDGSSLSTRAWVLQERLLSQRIIHFTPGRLFWEDNAGIIADDGTFASGDPDRKLIHASRILPALPATSGAGVPDCGLADALEPKPGHKLKWWDIVERYSRCQLTKATDKLVAISGIVRQIQKQTRVKSYAGLWADHFHQGLLWLSTERQLRRYQRNENARPASSWSWASVDGPVQYPIWNMSRGDSTILCEVKIMVVVARGVADTEGSSRGSVFDGPAILTLHGAFKQGLRFFDRRVEKPNWQNVADTRFMLLKTATQLWDVHDDDGRQIGWAALDEDERREIDGNVDNIACIKIASHSDDRPETGLVRGYLVLFVRRIAADVSERVGMGQIFHTPYFADAITRTISIV